MTRAEASNREPIPKYNKNMWTRPHLCLIQENIVNMVRIGFQYLWNKLNNALYLDRFGLTSIVPNDIRQMKKVLNISKKSHKYSLRKVSLHLLFPQPPQTHVIKEVRTRVPHARGFFTSADQAAERGRRERCRLRAVRGVRVALFWCKKSMKEVCFDLPRWILFYLRVVHFRCKIIFHSFCVSLFSRQFEMNLINTNPYRLINHFFLILI